MYASCYPQMDSESSGEVIERLPADWHDAVLRENALSFFRWPSAVPSAGR
jgi:hypothetical protein